MTSYDTRFTAGGGGCAGRMLGLAFFLAGGVILAIGLGVAIHTAVWLNSLQRIEGTVVAVDRGSHAIVEAETAEGLALRLVDSISTRPPPTIGSTRSIGFPPDHPRDAVVISLFGTWFLPAFLGLFGAIFAIVGFILMIFGARRQGASQPWNDGATDQGGSYASDQGNTTVINNYYGDDGGTTPS